MLTRLLGLPASLWLGGHLGSVCLVGAVSVLLAQTAWALESPGDAVRTVDTRPNVLLIVLDDVGYTDIGAWGGEIETPNIDALAKGGRLLTNFHTAPTCSPTRSMLMSGVDSHVAGLGSMKETIVDNQIGKPGYEGYLNFRVAALPELLSESGYRTYMTGKWHLGHTQETSPKARGFDKSFALLDGGAGHFNNMMRSVGQPGKANYREDGVKLEALPDGFYSTAFYTDRMIEYLEEGRNDERPFFAYLAYTAAHHPIQAPAESIEHFAGRFDRGYDIYNLERLDQMKALGLIDRKVSAQPPYPDQPAWHQLTAEEKKYSAKKMEVYAAMVYDVDRYVGKIIDYLKSTGDFENTFIFLMSDNGPEGHEMDSWPPPAKWMAECCDNSYANIGNADSYIWIGEQWMRGSNGPLRMYKGYTSQGGIKAPAIVHFPTSMREAKEPNSHFDSVVHVIDVMPTLLELVGIAHPGAGNYQGRDIVAMQGHSFIPELMGSEPDPQLSDRVLGWELHGRRGLRVGPWKVVYRPSHAVIPEVPAGIKTDTWQLYNLEADPGELRDLGAEDPEKLQELIGLWFDYARENGVVLPSETRGY